MQLVEYESDQTKSLVMSRAAELRDQGYDRSTALSMAWGDILGDNYEDADDDWDLDLIPQSGKRICSSVSVSNPVETQAGMFPVLGAVCYFLWCVLKFK